MEFKGQLNEVKFIMVAVQCHLQGQRCHPGAKGFEQEPHGQSTKEVSQQSLKVPSWCSRQRANA
eukprot:6477243-Amphidinium_carterae.2